MPVEFTELELPFEAAEAAHPAGPVVAVVDATPEIPVCRINRDPRGTFPCCPMCGGELRPEHAHYRCACGWRDSCCD